MLNVVFIGRKIVITHFINCFTNKGHDSSSLNLYLYKTLLEVPLEIALLSSLMLSLAKMIFFACF